MPFAYNLTREAVHYRHDTFTAGLKAAGFQVSKAPPGKVHPEDVMLIWNRYGYFHDMANQFERQGGTVIVAENGYMGRDEGGHQLFAMSIRGHNGSGLWPDGDSSRFEQLCITLKPWREKGTKIVIRGQRGIGAPGMASPTGWHKTTEALLRKLTTRQIHVVEHPGQNAEKNTDHNEYLKDAHALVIWSSSVGVKALAMGIPVFYFSPYWICSDSGYFKLDQLEQPLMDDALRLKAMQRMAWAQWRLSEIASGEAFWELLKCRQK